MSGAGPPYRVVQWATGNIGTRALRHVIEHPELTLAGVYVHTPAKAGKDAGDLSGLGPTGIVATGDIGEILALGADCVLICRLWHEQCTRAKRAPGSPSLRRGAGPISSRRAGSG